MHGAAMGVVGDKAMVATGHPLAARAAQTQLLAGASAVDAAIAADAVLGVVEPMATGIGGDLLAMLVPPGEAPVSYNGTGRAPLALTMEHIAALPQEKIPERHPLSVTTPGVVQGWYDLHQRYGKRPWSELFVDAIRIANDGFAVAPVAAREWALFRPVIARDPAAAALYRADRVPQAGEWFANPALARLLQEIAEQGPAAFYQGRIPEAAERAMRRHGGLLAAADFDAHFGNFCTPVSSKFRGADIYECPPNSHGVAVLHALAALDGQDLTIDSPKTTLAMVQAMEQAMGHAKKTVADPAGNTVCTTVVDGQGFAVTLMSSVFKRFGSGLVVDEGGFALQNRGHGFAQPGHINGPAPGKRPYHTVVPGAALRAGQFLGVFGVVGGAMQPQGQVQLLCRMLAGGEAPQSALDRPRWRLEGQRMLAIEQGTATPVIDALRAAGYIQPNGVGELGGRSDFGGAQCIMRLTDGRLCGASDKRKDGMALAVATP
ncbi:MAG: gamma-glutamyltransferase [Proteobacteria bacterium]|nr:gamma-glutamyltransferase [Pseudomonadota bacterium]